MTLQATLDTSQRSTSATPEDNLRARSLDLVRTACLEVMLEADEPLRTADVARLAAERLGLQLTEEELGGLGSLVRLVLDSDPLYSQSNRRWDLALRMGRAEGDRRKPVERSLEDFVDLIGHPVDTRPLGVLAAAVYGRLPEYYEKMLRRIAPSHERFFLLEDDRIAVSRWLLDLFSDEPEDVEADNFTDPDRPRALAALAEGISAEHPADFARELVLRAGEPVDGRALQYVTWQRFPDVDLVQLFVDMSHDEELVQERGPTWVSAAEHARAVEAIRGLVRAPEQLGELVAASLPAEEEELAILAPTVARVSDDDLNQVYLYVQSEERTYRLPELLQQVLEAFPGSRTYADIHESLGARMREDPRFQWVGGERFRLAGTIPAEVEALPENFTFDEDVYLGADGEELDRLVELRDWKGGLEEQIQHPLVQDLGDDDTVPGPAPTEVSFSPQLHHYVAGVCYVPRMAQGFFPRTPDILQVSLLTAAGERLEVWVNNRFGLVSGLKEWYDANLPWLGGTFSLARTESPEEYRLIHTGELNPLMHIPLDRLQQLLALRSEAATERLPLTDVVTRILRLYEEGLHFVTLFAAVNVVRRTRRSTLASMLSSQRFFVQASPESAVWQYDEKRAAKTKGRKKGGPRRPARDWDEDEDEEFEYD